MILLQILQNDSIKVLSVNPPMTFGERLSDPSTIIAICAIFVSIVGLVITTLYSRNTLKQTIKHNELSVVPILKIHGSLFIDKFTIVFNLENCGLGTARINSIKFVHNNQTFNRFEDVVKSTNFITEPFGKYYLFGENSYLSSQKVVDFIDYKCTNKDEFNKIVSLMKEVHIIIKYQSLYNISEILDDVLVNENYN